MIWREVNAKLVTATGVRGEYRLKESIGPVWNICLDGKLILARGTLSAAKKAVDEYDAEINISNS